MSEEELIEINNYLERLKTIRDSPTNYVYEYFLNITNKIGLSAEIALNDKTLSDEEILQINNLRSQMIDKVKSVEEQCLSRLNEKSFKDEMIKNFDLDIDKIEKSIVELKEIDIIKIKRLVEYKVKRLEIKIKNLINWSNYLSPAALV